MKKIIPEYLKAAKDSVPLWMEKIKYSPARGRYRMAMEAYEPYDFDSTSMLINVAAVIGTLSEEERVATINYMNSLQDEKTGFLIEYSTEKHICHRLNDGRLAVFVAKNSPWRKTVEDFIKRPGMQHHVIVDEPCATEEERNVARGWISRNGLVTLMELGGKPKYLLQQPRVFELTDEPDKIIIGPSGILHTKEEVEFYLEHLDWQNPCGWGAGSWAGTFLWNHRINQLMGDESAGTTIKYGVDWLQKKQSPQSGCWSDLSKVRLSVAVNIIFKIWIQAIPAVDFPVQYPEQVIDLCIRALKEDPVLSGVPDACSIFDVALVLDTALRFCDHRRGEVEDLAYSAITRFDRLYHVEDGAFSYGPDSSIWTHGGLHLAPPLMQSDAPGTSININALALLANLCGLRNELGWTPPTECRMGLPKI